MSMVIPSSSQSYRHHRGHGRCHRQRPRHHQFLFVFICICTCLRVLLSVDDQCNSGLLVSYSWPVVTAVDYQWAINGLSVVTSVLLGYEGFFVDYWWAISGYSRILVAISGLLRAESWRCWVYQWRCVVYHWLFSIGGSQRLVVVYQWLFSGYQ